MLNFIFTRCKEVCPLETARLREVEKLLGDRVGSEVFLYSISVDPDRDTPEVLASYRRRFGAGPGWTFLTGKKEEIVMLRKRLGLYNQEEAGGNLRAHTLNLIMGNQKTGQWMKASPFDNPQFLATKIGTWLHGWKAPPAKDRDYADAPELRGMSRGEAIFRGQCASCHASGSQVAVSGRTNLGPDLHGVTSRRDRAWLKRFIAAPDRMLAERDPQALALFTAYDQVVMPNFQLDEAEVEALLVYLEEENRSADCGCDHHR